MDHHQQLLSRTLCFTLSISRSPSHGGGCFPLHTHASSHPISSFCAGSITLRYRPSQPTDCHLPPLLVPPRLLFFYYYGFKDTVFCHIIIFPLIDHKNRD